MPGTSPDKNSNEESAVWYERIEKSHPYSVIDKVNLAKVESLRDSSLFESFDKGDHHRQHKVVLVDTIRLPEDHSNDSIAFYRACARPQLHFDPKTVRAAIVTCGGLCPGLNNVVREIVKSLHNIYGVDECWGVTGGWNGFHNPQYEPIKLTPDVVRHIHHSGGSFLRTSRGGFDVDKTIQFLLDKQINQLYVIGGDGTHRAAHKVHEECQKRGLNIAVSGIPKTIDNDVDYIDRSFGFNSAVEAAQSAIRVGLTEAQCTLPSAVAVIKLMGREVCTYIPCVNSTKCLTFSSWDFWFSPACFVF
jgi:6-phosphofructokinase 1